MVLQMLNCARQAPLWRVHLLKHVANRWGQFHFIYLNIKLIRIVGFIPERDFHECVTEPDGVCEGVELNTHTRRILFRVDYKMLY
jgi:hypothetical protein